MNERQAAGNATGFVGYVLLQAGRPLSSWEIVKELEKLPKIPPEVRVSLGLGKCAALRARYLNRHLMKLVGEGCARMTGNSPRAAKWAFVVPRGIKLGQATTTGRCRGEVGRAPGRALIRAPALEPVAA